MRVASVTALAWALLSVIAAGVAQPASDSQEGRRLVVARDGSGEAES